MSSMPPGEQPSEPSASEPTTEPTASSPAFPPAAPPPAAPPPAAASTVYWAATEEPGPAPGIEFAGHGGRLVAYIIDTILIGIVCTVILIIGFIAFGAGATVVGNKVTSVSTPGAILFLLSWTLAFAVIILYFPFFWARGGQTPGMRPFGLRVVRDRDGSRIGWGTALLRLVGLYVASAVLYIGLIWIFIDKRRRGWQDLIAGTVVIKRP